MKKVILFLALFLSPLICSAVDTTYYCTPSGAGTMDGLTPANAWGYAGTTTWFAVSAGNGDILYMEDGTWTFTGNWTSALDGKSTSTIRIIGCSDITTNPPTLGTESFKPFFQQGAYTFTGDDYWQVENIISSSTADQQFKFDTGAIIQGCKIYNYSTVVNRTALYVGGAEGRVYNNEIVSEKGIACSMLATINLTGNYLKNSSTGCVITGADNNIIQYNLISNCTAGIDLGQGGNTSTGNTLQFNTIYQCKTGININIVSVNNFFFNNIISSCTTGASSTGMVGTSIWNYNNFHGNVTDRTNINAGANDIALDPQFADAPNGDFRVGANMKAAGWPGIFPGGLTTGYMDIGAVQRQEPAAGGGGGGAGFFMMGN